MRPRTPTAPSAVVLLVQPCDDGLEVYVELLRHNGLTVIGVTDARDDWTVARKADVIVTGILLVGGMDGVELIARLRHDERTNHTPIIVLTACAWNTERERAEKAGCDLFLSKPCAPSELLRHVRQLLADSTLRHGRGTPTNAQRSNAPGENLGIATDSVRLKRPS